MFLHRRDGSTKLLFQICGNETKKKSTCCVCCLFSPLLSRGGGEEKGLPDALLKAAFLCLGQTYWALGHLWLQAMPMLKGPAAPSRGSSEEVQAHCGCHSSLIWGTRSHLRSKPLEDKNNVCFQSSQARS